MLSSTCSPRTRPRSPTSFSTTYAATISFDTPGRSVSEVSSHLAGLGVSVGCGNFYALRCVEALGIQGDPGVIRVSMVHYNTDQEVDRLLRGLDEIL